MQNLAQTILQSMQNLAKTQEVKQKILQAKAPNQEDFGVDGR